MVLTAKISIRIWQVMFTAALTFIMDCARAGVQMSPKHHLILHLFHPSSVAQTGNPRLFANWYDESLNSDLAALSKRAHAHKFEARVLTDFPKAHRAKAAKRRVFADGLI